MSIQRENLILKINFFLQLIGLPMGCKCGPSVANLYLYALEKTYLNRFPDQLYYRFIDDIFIASINEVDLTLLKLQFGYLKLNIVHAQTVTFLDLNISFNNLINMFNFSLYIKPTNTFSYLKTDSNHPSSIFKNIPKSLFIRIRRICSSFTDYLYFSSVLKLQLVLRGYSYKLVNAIALNIGRKSRELLLPYKNKSNNIDKNTLFCSTKFNTATSDIKKTFSSSFNDVKTRHECLKKSILFYINKIAVNLGSLFVHDTKLDPNHEKHYIKCRSRNCRPCKFASQNPSIIANNLNLPILSMSNCTTSEVVYIICCKKCRMFYVGQTKRSVKSRINEHLLSIINFKKRLNTSIANYSNLNEISRHFNKNRHSLNDFCFFVFKAELSDDNLRFSTESDVINLFLARKIGLINEKLNNIYCIKSFSFA
jgi:hypothetical protein